MYKITWDKETGGVLLHSRIVEGTLGISPRPVFFEELDLLGLDKLGWTYPHVEEPIMWAVNKQYWYRGVRLFDAKGANIYTKPTLEIQSGIEPMELVPVDVHLACGDVESVLLGKILADTCIALLLIGCTDDVAVSIHHGTHQVGMVMVGVIVTCHDELGVLDAHQFQVLSDDFTYQLVSRSVAVFLVERVSIVSHWFADIVAPLCGVCLKDLGNSLVVQERNAFTMHDDLGFLVLVVLPSDVVKTSLEVLPMFYLTNHSCSFR